MQIIVVNSYINMKSITHSCTMVLFAIITYIAANRTVALQTNFLYGLKQFIIQVFLFLCNRKTHRADM